jgi:hypothetical protein
MKARALVLVSEKTDAPLVRAVRLYHRREI